MIKKLRQKAGHMLLSVLIVLSFGYGYYGLRTYVLPLSQDNVRQARVSLVADQTEVLITGAARAYEEGKDQEVVKSLELALEKLVDRTGRYKATDRWKLARIYFLLGKSYHRMEKFDKAIRNYEDALRMDANHLPAKYNLEMIQMSGGGNGGSGNQTDPGSTQPRI